MEGVEGMLSHVIQISQMPTTRRHLAYLRGTNASRCKVGSAEAGML